MREGRPDQRAPSPLQGAARPALCGQDTSLRARYGSRPMAFRLDPRLRDSSHAVAELTLCDARLQDDARFPWIVLVPRYDGLTEIAELGGPEREALWAEIAAAGQAVRAVGSALGRSPLKLNHGQLGNVVAQLHVHVVGRRPDDAAWPGPVWGHGAPECYEPQRLSAAVAAAAEAFGASGV